MRKRTKGSSDKIQGRMSPGQDGGDGGGAQKERSAQDSEEISP